MGTHKTLTPVVEAPHHKSDPGFFNKRLIYTNKFSWQKLCRITMRLRQPLLALAPLGSMIQIGWFLFVECGQGK